MKRKSMTEPATAAAPQVTFRIPPDAIWIDPLRDFDAGDPSALVALIRAGTPMATDATREAIASIVEGRRRPDKRGRHRRKVGMKGELRLSIRVAALRARRAMQLEDVESEAARKGIEPSEERNRILKQYRVDLQKMAREAGMSVRTLEGVVARIRRMLGLAR